MAETTAALPMSLEGFAQLQSRQKIVAMVSAAAIVAALVGAWLWAKQPDYAVLFSNLSDKDGGSIVSALSQQNVPYKFSEGGGAILVPSGQVHDVRLRLASIGLPKGGMVGFELMETQKLGISQFAEQVNYQRALEGELARSIQSLAAVQAARVHLAIPKQSAFLRDGQNPSASVLLNLHPGRTLDAGQISGIVHLVSSSVPQLAAESVTVVDQGGNLVSGMKDRQRISGLDPTQLDYVQQLEKSYIQRIEGILTPITGRGNVRAQVTADVDFSQVEQTAETYKPNGTPEANAIRSQQSSESASRDPGAAGIPGALSNQPPVPATAPITAPSAPGTPAVSGAQPPNNTRKDATVNYELDKTTRHIRSPTGTVKRLSVAVAVNHKQLTGSDGKLSSKPLSENELKQITDLTREAMGYNKERGDTLNVANTPFETIVREVLPDTPLWKDPSVISLAKEIGRYLLFGALATWLFFGVVRPFLREIAARAAAEREQRRLTAAQESGVAGHLPAPAGAALRFDQKLLEAKTLAKQDPKLVANVIRDWVDGRER